MTDGSSIQTVDARARFRIQLGDGRCVPMHARATKAPST